MGKEFEQVYDDKGKAIGKKDADGNFIPYKARGRPVVKGGPRNVTERKVTANMDLEEMLNNEVIRREKPQVTVKKQRHQDSSESDYNLP